MSNNTVLKKEFKSKDVERMRNLVTGKYGNKTTISVGYEKAHVMRNEGDVWEEDGRSWTITNGVKTNITKLDGARKKATLPLFCPSCTKLMKHKFDKGFYHAHGKCYSCVVEFETKLRLEGKWDDYERKNKLLDIANLEEEFTAFMEAQLTALDDTYVSEQGDVEQWRKSTQHKELLQKQLQEGLSYIKSLKN